MLRITGKYVNPRAVVAVVPSFLGGGCNVWLKCGGRLCVALPPETVAEMMERARRGESHRGEPRGDEVAPERGSPRHLRRQSTP